MKRYFLRLAYDGSQYKGWQVQPNTSTVQGVISDNLSKLTGKQISIIGCGRTDAGVHAKIFYAHFDYESILPQNMVYKLNRMLPDDIGIYDCFAVENNQHTRFDAIERTYQYHFHWNKDPFKKGYSLYHPQLLKRLERMKQASALLMNYQDFAPLAKKNEQNKNSLCEIRKVFWHQDLNNNSAILEISANRFLRNMIRRIVGKLLLIGREKLSIKTFEEIMHYKGVFPINYCAPAHGLFLTEIKYPFIER